MIPYIVRFISLSHALPTVLVISSILLYVIHLNLLLLLPILLAFWIAISPSVHVFTRVAPFPFAFSFSKKTSNDYKVVVGGGWSFFLNKRGAGVVTFDRSRGHIRDNWWKSGSTIQQVQRYLKISGKTLGSHPSVKTSTLGGWIFSNSHGSGGTLWTPQFDKIKVYDQLLQVEKIVAPKELFHSTKFIQEQRRYIIREVQIIPVEDVFCCRHAFKMTNESDARQFLQTPSYLRLAQIGGRGMLCLLWVPDQCKENKNTFSKFNLWFQADVLSAWQPKTTNPWFDWPVEPTAKWSARVRLSQANDFSPAPIPLFAPLAFAYTNFEVFVDKVPTPKVLYNIGTAFTTLLATTGGRCELRCGRTLIMLDFSYPTYHKSVSVVFETLKNVLGDVDVRLHKGKALVSTHPLRCKSCDSGV